VASLWQSMLYERWGRRLPRWRPRADVFRTWRPFGARARVGADLVPKRPGRGHRAGRWIRPRLPAAGEGWCPTSCGIWV